MVFQSCLTARAEPDRGIGGLCKLEFLGFGGLPDMDKFEPLEKTGPFENLQVAFMTIPVNTCPRGVRPVVFGAQIMAEVGSIDMLANCFLIPARDPGSLNRYADSLSVRMCSIISGLGLFGREEVIIGRPSTAIFLKAASESTWPGSLSSS